MKNTKVIGFVGKSGCGKSFRASWVARENNIRYIIDDGLFITSKRVIAGSSAKREKTKLASVKRALFVNKDHVLEVRQAIEREKPEAILILGTSDGMVEKIAVVLGLNKPERIIHIEDVATEKEIEAAIRMRREQGKHIIPVPTFEIKKDFSGILMDSIKGLFNLNKSEQKKFGTEKAVVRPTFSYLGEYHISDKVIISICRIVSENVLCVSKMSKATVTSSSTGVIINIEVSITLGRDFFELSKEIQDRVMSKVEEITSINVIGVNVLIKSIEIQQ